MISIIIPVYNSELFLNRCLNSIIIQTYSDIEVILVDDGSTDTSLDICNFYARKDSRIKVISKKNEGAGIARNTGLKIAKGDYIGFVDSDDYIEPSMYEKMYSSALKNNADIVQCGYRKVDDSGNIIIKSGYRDLIINNPESCFIEYCKQNNIDNYSPCKIYRKDLIKDIYFGNLSYSEDAYFIIQAFMRCKKLVVISSELYYYVQTVGSACRRPYNAKFEDTVKAGEYMYELTLKCYPHLAYYIARYTATWCRFNYLGIINQNNISTEKSDYYLSKFKQYYLQSKIVFPHNIKLLLLSLFYFSPWLYQRLKN